MEWIGSASAMKDSNKVLLIFLNHPQLQNWSKCKFINSHNADFLYFDVSSTNINVIFENNMVRFRGKNNNVKFGKLIDVDGTKYYATEI